jgi:glyoxylase-like metal-dependent hydrolase (beta-lactamase superfamily II)
VSRRNAACIIAVDGLREAALGCVISQRGRPEKDGDAMASNVVRVGDVEIMMLSDGMLEFDLCNFFPTIPEGDWHGHESHLTDEHKVRFNLGSYLIRADGRTMLIDTGLGPRPKDTPDVPWGTLLRDFAANGVRPDEIDMVVMTHLHRDHVGWNLTDAGGRWVPTFPRARYWVSTRDWEACHQPDVQPTRFPNAPTCVWPLADLGLVEFMDGEHRLTPTLTAMPTPGHTPGHMSILVTSRGERALVLGDAAHSPVQIQEPDWVSRADMDPDLTRQTRRALIERLEREQILVAAGHFQAPGFGRIVRLDGRRYWRGL